MSNMVAQEQSEVYDWNTARDWWHKHIYAPKLYVPLGRNTWLEWRPDSDTFVITFHGSPLITYRRHGVIEFHDNGNRSITTRRRLNEFTPFHMRVGYSYDDNQQWTVYDRSSGHTESWQFTDGLRVGIWE